MPYVCKVNDQKKNKLFIRESIQRGGSMWPAQGSIGSPVIVLMIALSTV